MNTALKHTTDSSNIKDIDDATIVIIDDEPLVTETLQTILEDAGYNNLICINDSKKAVDILLNKEPSVVLLDIIMPEVSGLDILTRIRSKEKLKYIPVIILTSSNDTEKMVRALNIGATDLLAKPVDPVELELRVRNALVTKTYQERSGD